MKVSVIIPCYNAEKYLEACLQSVLAQSETDLEVILVDDGSSDNTLSLMQAYEKLDERVHVFHQQNAGVSAARNLGLAHASGEWVTFVDGDDLLFPDSIACMLGAAGDETDMVVCAHETFDDTGVLEIFRPETCWMDQNGDRKRHAVALRLIEGDSVLNIMCNKLHRRALLEREGICLTPGLKIAEDALFNLEAVLCGREIVYLDKIAYRYRIHGASATQTRARSEYDVHLPWFHAMRALLERRGVMERYYSAYADSVVLRLYKDGGIGGVMRMFKEKAAPLLVCGTLDQRKMSASSRVLLRLCESGSYAAVYPVIAMYQILCRKIGAVMHFLRAKRE